MSKRGRACEACSKIKIKCELGANTGLEPPCERCVRLNKQCVLSQPKRQKDRVAELEAQVEALTRLLQAQGVQDPSTADSSPGSEAPNSVTLERANNKRRRIDDVSSSSGPSATLAEGSSTLSVEQDLNVANLDRLVACETQQRLVDRYFDEQLPVFPIVPISGDCSLASLRAERTVLLFAIIYAAGPGMLPIEQQEGIAKILLDHLTNITVSSPKSQTLDLIQAILITCLFYRSPRHHVHLSVFGLIEVGLQAVSKLGHGGPLSAPPTSPVSTSSTDVDSLDAWRVILVSHLLATAMNIFLRRKPSMKWAKEHDMCLLQLQYSAISKPTDPWLSQLIRAEHTCRNKILNFRLTIPSQVRTPTLLFWENIATAYMHEAVLHTATNKQSFAAPFVAENLSVTDFPAPAVVTQEHTTALFELTSAVQAMIDLYSSLDTETLAAMPGFLHSSRAAYALFILAKLFIATTAPGNTYGAVLDPVMTLVGEYANKLIDNGTRVRALDERCAPARILFAAVGIKEWYLNFVSITAPSIPYHQDLAALQSATSTIVTSGLEMPESETYVNFAAAQTAAQDAVDWENFFYYSSNTADFGLETLFDEEPQPFRVETYDDAAYQA